jgi:hypothetical protein
MHPSEKATNAPILRGCCHIDKSAIGAQRNNRPNTSDPERRRYRRNALLTKTEE